MKIIKRIVMVLLALTTITMLAGCFSQKQVTNFDIRAFSHELLEQADFEDELSPVDGAIIPNLYHIKDYEDAQVYISSGATAEEIAVFEFDSIQTAAEGLQQVLVRIEEQKAGFESYIPKEIPKLDNAVVKQAGKYVIVCVSNSSVAEQVISQYIQNNSL